MSDISTKFIADDAVVVQVQSNTMAALPCGCLGFCAGRCKKKTKSPKAKVAAEIREVAKARTVAAPVDPARGMEWLETPGPMPAPDYARGGVRLYRADALDILPYWHREPGIETIVIYDAPYSRKVHESAAATVQLPDGAERQGDFGFGHLTPALRSRLARHAARIATRWTLVFSESDGAWLWRIALQAAGLHFDSTGYWRKLGAKPRTNGSGPAEGLEAITICHRPLTKEEGQEGWQKHRRWNGGGKHGVWEYAIVRDNEFEPRLHTTPKPPKLMISLVEDFSDPGNEIIDFTAGSMTTCIGAIRAAGGPRRFVGFERDPETFERGRDRIDAELEGVNYRTYKTGQRGMFPLAPTNDGVSDKTITAAE